MTTLPDPGWVVSRLRCLLANSNWVEEWLWSGHSTINAWLVEWCRDTVVVLLESFPISTEELWSSVRVTIRFLVTFRTKALLPWLLSLAGWPDLGRVLVVPNFFHLRMMEVTVFLGTFNIAEMFWYPSPDLCFDIILSRCSTDNSFDLIAWFLLWHALLTVGHYIDRCVPLQIMSIQLNLLQVDANQVVETSQGWPMETGCTCGQFWV
jgi:hypothetical protein